MGLRREWRIRSAQAGLLEWLQYHWWGRGVQIEVIDGPQDDVAWMQYINGTAYEASDATNLVDYLLVYATDPSGWTVVEPIRMYWSNEVCSQISWDLQAPILEAEYNSIVEQRHWVWFDDGQLQAERWEFPDGKISTYQRSDEHPIQATLSFDDVFTRIGLSFSTGHILKGCKRVLLEKNARD